MSRRGRGEDSIYQDGDRWRCAASLGYGPDGRRIRKKVTGATKSEVLRKLRELRADLDSGIGVPDDRLTLATFLDRWVSRTLPGQVSEMTLDSYADTVRLHLGRRSVARRFASLAALSVAPRIRGDEGRALSVAEARRLLTAVHGTRHEALFTVMLSFGLRRGETLGLHWSALLWRRGRSR